jgi:glutamyl-tRNA reductase
MKLGMVGCHHHRSSDSVRERLAFSAEQAEAALMSWRDANPQTEAVLLSTCNRIELYAASEAEAFRPTASALARHLADFHKLSVDEFADDLVSLEDEAAVCHLFRVAASLDSMVVGEPQILAQVKQAYELARGIGSTGPLTHQFFQAAVRTARRVAGETSLHRHRVSVASIAIADFASGIFETFHNKRVLVVGAGEMAEETLRYLVDAGARQPRVTNRSPDRAQALADRWDGQAVPWNQLLDELGRADLVISTTGADEPIVSLETYRRHVAPRRYQRPLFILDLAMPRDFEPPIAGELGTYLYSIEDLAAAAERNRNARQTQLPLAERIVADEAHAFLAETRHRASGPVIAQLRESFELTQSDELDRLFRKMPDLDERSRREITQFADRLVGKLLHPPLESLRDESHNGSPSHLLEALRRLFQLRD